MYNRVLLKLSGEALKGANAYGIDPKTVNEIAKEITEIKDLGVEIAIVVGAGNLWRGKTGEELGMDRAQADYMGMLGTIMNALALQDALEAAGTATRVMTALPIAAVAEPYIRRRALRHLSKGRVIILAGGTGSPYFSTDTAAALRGAELDVNAILMAKNGVEGVYDKDPRKFSDALLLERLSHTRILEERLEVMDSTAASLCRENNIDILVFNMNKPGNMKKAVLKEKIGTVVTTEV
ncbi:Uridylate kinase [Alteracholeplasma palmae J233]|uniref:Uridylate kinase n=1 Tax=Alteracholeplasma palmae (strain ATCC 49389 / J233) TaxID=1318466 RepID=U4KK18_ALTPJ|nr:Uridylate kinase [Alteracholeplasma palmae J233]